MKVMKLGAVAGLALALAACPPADRTDVAVEDPLERPAVEAPATVPAEAHQSNLEAVAASGVTGEVTATPREGSTEIWVTVRGAPINESLGVRVQSGTCESPGVEIARIDAIGTDAMGQGQSRTDVGHAPHLIMDGNHIVAVYAPGTEPERDLPIACTTLGQQNGTQM